MRSVGTITKFGWLRPARRTQLDALAGAQAQLDGDNARAQADAVARWAAVEATPWATYQATLAGDQAQNTIDSALALAGMQKSLDLDAFIDAQAHDLADFNQTQSVDLAGYNEVNSAAPFLQAVQKALDGLQEHRAVLDAQAWQTYQHALADDDLACTVGLDLASEVLILANDAANLDLNLAIAQADYDLAVGVDPTQVDAEIAAATLQDNATRGSATFQFKASQMLEETRGESNVLAASVYETSCANDQAAAALGDDSQDERYEEHLAGAYAQQNLDVAEDAADNTYSAQQADGAQALAHATAEQGYWDSLAGYQQTQDVSDAQAQQLFENTTADQYAQALAAWAASLASSVGNTLSGVPTVTPAAAAWALEQSQFAEADDVWVHAVTLAQVNDVIAADGAQTGWTQTTDLAAVGQVISDVAAWLNAAHHVHGDAWQNASDVSNDWTSEVLAISAETSSYDQAAIAATSGLISDDANSWGADLQSIMQREAEYLTDVAWEDEQLATGHENQVQYNANVAQDRLAEMQSDAQEAVLVGTGVLADFKNEVSTIDGAKVTWATNSADDEADYTGWVAHGRGEGVRNRSKTVPDTFSELTPFPIPDLAERSEIVTFQAIWAK